MGIAADVAYLGSRGAFAWTGTEAAVGWTFVVLCVVSLLLVIAVWVALRGPAYSAVMAATGLSYLAVLTVMGASVAGRTLIADPSDLLGAMQILSL